MSAGKKSNNFIITPLEWIKEDLRAGTGSANLDFNERIKRLRANGEKVYHLGFGQCPFPVPLEAVEELKKHADRSTYAPMAGIPQLRQSIIGKVSILYHFFKEPLISNLVQFLSTKNWRYSDFHQKHDEVNYYDESGVICGPGSKELIYLTMNALETTIIILKPAWPTYMPQTKLANKKVLCIERTVENSWKLTGIDKK